MPLYTPGRRRAIVLLLLTSVLLLTLDLRGNAVFDAARRGFNTMMEPLESAADVATKPVVDAWRGITQYEDVRQENDRLRDELAGVRADQIAAQAAIQDQQELLADRDLPSLGSYQRITATVVGARATNIDTFITINKGSQDGIAIGMAVVARGGLVGKVTRPLLPDRATVMLITDAQYASAVKVIAAAPPTTTTTTPPSPPSSLPGEAVPGTNVPADSAPPTTPPAETVPPTTPPPTTPPPTTAPATTAESTTTTTAPIDMSLERDFGKFNGRGPSALPQVDLLDDSPTLGRIVVGDLVFTAGGDDFLAPPDIPIGVVRNVIRGSAAEGPQLEVEPSADLDRLNYVEVIVFRPPSETGAGTTQPQADGG